LEHVLDLRAGLRTAEATLRCALERRESRGAHTRSDFPNLDPGLERNFYTRLEGRDRPLTVWSEPVPAIPTLLKRMLTDEEMEVAGRLLE
jgi:succinate dehydrogenase / fumarate reductase flavoprotein subunit